MKHPGLIAGMFFVVLTLAACGAGRDTDELVDRLVELTKDYYYIDYDDEWLITGVEHDDSSNALSIVTESLLAIDTVTIPLARTRFAKVAFFDDGETNGFSISCAAGDECLAVKRSGEIAESFGAALDLDLEQTTDVFDFGCEPAHCDEILSILVALRGEPENAGPTLTTDRSQPEIRVLDNSPIAEPVTPVTPPASDPRPVARDLVAAANRVNTRIDRSAAPLPGFLPTTGIAPLGDGRVAFHTDSCAAARGGCAAGAITDNEIVVGFDVTEINASSLGIQPTPSGYAVVFSCTTGACIRSPDGRLRLAGYGLACVDQAECNRLVIDLLSLLDAAQR